MDFQAQFEEESKHKIKKKVKKRNRICTAQSYDIKLLHMAIKFFECSLCPSTSFNTLQALQKHVVTHKDRVTSWDLRAKGLLTKKKKKKSKKSKNKEGTSESNIKGTENTVIGTESTVKGAESTVEGVKSIEDSSANQEKEKQISSDVANAINKNLEKIYKCGGCGKQFTLGYYLKLHVRSHTGEKPYICQECGLSFITASKLNRHRKQLHLSRKECRICRCPFSNMDLLRAHFHLHHGDCIIDGEPYDFNAILPYLKETEHELQIKNEEEKKLKKLENTIIKQEVCKIEYENKPTPPPIVKTELNEVPNVEPVQTSPIQENTDHPIWDSFTSFCSWENQEQVSSKEVEVELEVSGKVELEVPGKKELEVPGKLEVEVPGNVNVKTEIVKDYDGFDNDNESSDEYFGEGTWTEPLVEIENSDDEPIINIKRNRKKKINKSTLVPCEVCKKEIRHGYMVIHMRSHTKERPFKCDKCDKAFITNGKLMEHGLTHMRCDDEIVQEDIKPKIEVKYENDSEIDSSKPKKIKKEVKRRSYKCPKCEEIFEFQTLLKTHLKIHKKPKTFKCNYCLQDCHDQETLSEHEKQHGGPKPYVCTICGRNYTKKFSMIYHRKTHDPDVTNSHTCTACNRSFDTQRKLARHFLVHRPSKVVLRYECPVCAHIFNTRHHVEMHLRSHEREGVIVPENRGQILAMVLQNTRKIPLETDSTSNLTHLLPNDERSRICNICGEIFEHFIYLEEHLKSHAKSLTSENVEKKHICPVCNKGFKLSYYLKLHSFTHTKEKPIICQQCGKGFITRGKLNRHLETHTGVKKYQCHICCKFFTRPSYLRIHIRTIHGTQDYHFKHDGLNIGYSME